MGEKEVIRISAYLPKELKARVQALAKEQGRTMNEIIVQFCEDSMGRETIEDTLQKIKSRLDRLEKEVYKK